MSKKKPARLTKAGALGHIPVKNPEVREARLGDHVRLSYPLPVSPLVRGIVTFFSKRPPGVGLKKLDLDVMGTHVWDFIDGHRTVAELTADFAEKFDITQSEAEASVTAFLRDLGHRRLIAIR